MASNYDFRILINTNDGTNLSYGTQSLVEVQSNTSLVVNTDEMVHKINNMPKIKFFNGKTHATASSLFNLKGATQFSGSTGVDGGPSDYQFISASIKGNSDSGSIVFHANNVANNNGEFIKRYKFFGNKVCNVLGVPENYWIYADKFRLTNTGSEQNYVSGDILAQSLHLTDNFAISNAGAIESDLPMKHAKDTDRWIKWTDVSSSIPQNDMLIGYSNQSNEYMIRMQNNKNLIISSSSTTLSGDLNLYGKKIYGDDDNNTFIDFGGTANTIDLYSANRNQVNVGYSQIIFNEAANDVDVRMESVGNNNMFRLDAGRNKVGIGTNLTNASPTLHVGGNLKTDSHITASGNIDATGTGSFSDGRFTGKVGIGEDSPSSTLDVAGNAKIQGGGRPSIRFVTEDETTAIADSFSGDTDKAYVFFDDNSNSNDPGFILHETRHAAETNEGVLHLCPSDDNSVSDYVSIHGTNDPDKIKLHTDGQISGVTHITASGGIMINGDAQSLTIRNSSETEAGIKFQDKDAVTTQHFELLYNCSSEDLRFNSDTNNNILYLEHDGNVGIGHNNPSTKLQVNGAISSSGAISAGPAAGGGGYAATNGIVWRLFTGITGNTNTNTEILHGITNGKKRIVSVSVNIQTDDDGPGSIPSQAFIAGAGNFQDETTATREFQTWYDDDYLYIHIDSGGDSMDNNRYTAIVMYTQVDLY